MRSETLSARRPSSKLEELLAVPVASYVPRAIDQRPSLSCKRCAKGLLVTRVENFESDPAQVLSYAMSLKLHSGSAAAALAINSILLVNRT